MALGGGQSGLIRQALAALGAARGQHFAATAGLQARAKTALPGAAEF